MVGSKLEQQILALFGDFNASYSILQISKKLDTSYPHVYNKVQQLVKSGILNLISVGPSHLCRLNLDNDLTITLLSLNEIALRDQWLKSARQPHLLEKLRLLKSSCPGLIALSARHTLFVILNTQKDSRLAKQNLSSLSLHVECLTKQNFLPKAKDILPEAIVLLGFEAYYELAKSQVAK